MLTNISRHCVDVVEAGDSLVAFTTQELTKIVIIFVLI